MDQYEELRQVLHKHPTGAPESEYLDEILRILFTPEEVQVALGMGFIPRDVPAIAAAAGVSAEEAHARCEAMADKGIVFSREKGGEMGYALLPTIPGLFEFPFMRGGGTPMHERLGELWQEYHHAALGREFGASPTPLTRVVPVQEALGTAIEALPYEVLARMLDQVQTFALAQCACRVSVGGCDKPRDVCLVFDRFAGFLSARGFARLITRAEAEDVLRRSEEAGLVHTTPNTQERPGWS